MNAVRIVRKLDSETLHLPELKPFVGRQVEIFVYDAVERTKPTDEDWEAFLAEVPPDEDTDPELYKRYREFNRQHNIAPDL